MQFVHLFNGLIAQLVFPYLEIKHLLTASKWKKIKLKNIMVIDWDKFVDIINENNLVSFDTQNMIISEEIYALDVYWKNFNRAIIKAKNLKQIYLYENPPHVVERIIETLPQLEILRALSIKKSLQPEDPNNDDDHCMILTFINISQLSNLTELRIKGLSKIVFDHIHTII